MESESYWSCAQVVARQERRAVINLRRQGLEAMYPFFMGLNHRGESVSEPLFPGYIFLQIAATRTWSVVNSTYGILRLLVENDPAGIPRPCHIHGEFADSLAECYRSLRPNPSGSPAAGALLEEGAAVRILRGAFKDHNAEVEWSREDRLGLLFTILGRRARVELDRQDVVQI